MINEVYLKDRKGTKHVMSVDTYTRWLCLMEAISLIEDKASKLNMNLNNEDFWLKPVKINKYIEERYPALRHDIVFDEYLD